MRRVAPRKRHGVVGVCEFVGGTDWRISLLEARDAPTNQRTSSTIAPHKEYWKMRNDKGGLYCCFSIIGALCPSMPAGAWR